MQVGFYIKLDRNLICNRQSVLITTSITPKLSKHSDCLRQNRERARQFGGTNRERARQ
jgi:hypothetical protein